MDIIIQSIGHEKELITNSTGESYAQRENVHLRLGYLSCVVYHKDMLPFVEWCYNFRNPSGTRKVLLGEDATVALSQVFLRAVYNRLLGDRDLVLAIYRRLDDAREVPHGNTHLRA